MIAPNSGTRCSEAGCLPLNSPLRDRDPLDVGAMDTDNLEHVREVSSYFHLLLSRRAQIEDARERERCLVNSCFSREECSDCMREKAGHRREDVEYEFELVQDYIAMCELFILLYRVRHQHQNATM